MLGRGLVWSMQACHETIPSRREKRTVSGTLIGCSASSRRLTRWPPSSAAAVGPRDRGVRRPADRGAVGDDPSYGVRVPPRDLAGDHAAQAPADERGGRAGLLDQVEHARGQPLDVAPRVAGVGAEAPAAGVVPEPPQVAAQRRARQLRRPPARGCRRRGGRLRGVPRPAAAGRRPGARRRAASAISPSAVHVVGGPLGRPRDAASDALARPRPYADGGQEVSRGGGAGHAG